MRSPKKAVPRFRSKLPNYGVNLSPQLAERRSQIMSKKQIKLDKSDLKELQLRKQMIKQHQLTIQALDSQLVVWLLGKFFKYGLDSQKEYNFDVISGEITEVKQPEKGGGS